MKFFFFLFLLGTTTHFCHAQKETGTGSDTIYVKGLVDSPYYITRSNMAGLPVQVQKEYKVTDHDGRVHSTLKNVKGVLLKDMVKRAAVQMPQKKSRGEYYVLVTATDGYKTIYAWNELMFSPAGKSTYLLYEKDGKPFAEDGPFVAVCISDDATGPRHVKWVKEIEVRRAE